MKRPNIFCRLSLDVGRQRAAIFEKALKPDTSLGLRGAKVRISREGSRLNIEIQSTSLSHARAAVLSHSNLIKCLGELFDSLEE